MIDRTRLPQPGPERPFSFPEIRRERLPTGLEIWTAEHRGIPLVTILVLVRAGAAYDPLHRPGLAAITSDLLDEGCGDLDALALHETLGRLGAQLDTEVGSDAALLALTTLARFTAPSLDLLAKMIASPRFEARDFERVRELRLNRLLQMRELPPALAERAFTQHLYGDHPYGHLAIGTEESLRELPIEEVRAFHAQMYRPSRVTIIAAGDAPHEELAALVRHAFGTWHPSSDGHPVSDPALGPVPSAESRRLALIPRARAPQSELRIGHVAAARSSPDYHALVTLNMVLGGQFVSRINLNLRERKGYTYGVRTAFEFRRGPGPFVLHASVQSDATMDAVREVFAEFEAIRGAKPVTAEELELGRASLTRGYPRGFETAEQIARAIAQLTLYELPDDYFTRFVPTVLALTPDDLTRVAKQHIEPEKLLTVIVGDPEKVTDV
jgi:zinc protease